MSAALSRVLANTSADVAAYTPTGVRTRADFSAAAAAVARHVREGEGGRAVLAAADCWNFAVGLFGVLSAGKPAVILPNLLSATVQTLSDANDVVLDDGIIETLGHAAPAALEIAADARLDIYTSGTAAEPVRVTKRFSQLMAEVHVLEATFGRDLAGGVALGTVPHHHIYGLLFRILWPLAARRPFVSIMCSDPQTMCTTLEKHVVNIVVSCPAHLSRFARLLDLSAYSGSIRAVFSSGGPLALSDARIVKAALGRDVIEVYGSTESGGIAWRRQTQQEEWTPFDRVGIDATDAGALVVRSPFATHDASALTTADHVELLGDGRFRLLGRLDRVIKIEEKRLSLAAMENKLREHPWVSDAGVVLLARQRNTIGTAVILNSEGAVALTTGGRRAVIVTLHGHLARHFEPVALPRRWRFPPSLPYNDRGKLKNSQMFALFALPAA